MKKQRLIQGNEACAHAALYAGCDFYAGYPITPSSEIMEILSHQMPACGRVFIQMEDEIASMAAVIGASLGGATGYAINPARDLGPRIMYTLLPIKGKGSSNWGYAWIPIVGPLVGVAAVVIFYHLTGAGAGSLP